MKTTSSQASQYRLQLMEVASVFSKLLYNHIMDRLRMGHSCRMDASTNHRLP